MDKLTFMRERAIVSRPGVVSFVLRKRSERRKQALFSASVSTSRWWDTIFFFVPDVL